MDEVSIIGETIKKKRNTYKKCITIPCEYNNCGRRFSHNDIRAMRLHRTNVHICLNCKLIFSNQKEKRCHPCERGKEEFPEDIPEEEKILHRNLKTYSHKYETCQESSEFKTPQEFLDNIIYSAGSDKEPCGTCVSNLVTRVAEIYSGGFKCFVCEKIVKGKISNFEQHLVHVHIPAKPYNCTICEKRFSGKHLLKLHLRIHNGTAKKVIVRDPVRVQCIFCERLFNKKSIKRHIQEVHSGRPQVFTCHICGKQLSHERSLKKHIKHVHENIEQIKYECDICNKKVISLSKHKSAVHKLNKKPRKKLPSQTCNICHKEFVHLSQHMIFTHGMETKSSLMREIIYCQHCDHGFKCRSRLKHHIKTIHEKSLSYPCEKCDKIFLKNENLQRHMLIHNAVKNYKCATCGLSFNQKCTLTRHQVVHTGEKPFECRICGQRFTQKPYMKVHEKKCVEKKKSEESMSEKSENEVSESENEVSESEKEESESESDICEI